MDQPPALAFTASADAWPGAIETEIGTPYAPLDAGKDFDFDKEIAYFVFFSCCYWFTFTKSMCFTHPF